MSLSALTEAEIKQTQHPIDAWYEEKMAEETVNSTAGMREITYQAQMKWEAEVNKVYKRLMQKLTQSQQAKQYLQLFQPSKGRFINNPALIAACSWFAIEH